MEPSRFASRESIAERMSGFMAHLRANGVPVGLPETGTALAALAEIDATDLAQVRLALRAVTATDADRGRRFDDLFNAYWLATGRAKSRPAPPSASMAQGFAIGHGDEGGTGAPDAPETGEGEAEGGGTGLLKASRIARLKRTDLRGLVRPQDLAEAEAVATRLARAIRDRRSRRHRAAKRGAALDLRRIARRSVGTGGDPLHLFRRRRPDRPVNIAAICDVSGSMTVYARVFLAFLRGLVAADARTDAWLMHTRLVRISDALRDADHMRSVERLGLMAQGFGGGTRIGESLARFNEQYASAVNGRTVVLILSDGYDTDPPDLMGRELARLKRRGCRIVWLNPLKGWDGYEPVARGMAAALPHLDHFAAANTLDSLAALEGELAGL